MGLWEEKYRVNWELGGILKMLLLLQKRKLNSILLKSSWCPLGMPLALLPDTTLSCFFLVGILLNLLGIIFFLLLNAGVTWVLSLVPFCSQSSVSPLMISATSIQWLQIAHVDFWCPGKRDYILFFYLYFAYIVFSRWWALNKCE